MDPAPALYTYGHQRITGRLVTSHLQEGGADNSPDPLGPELEHFQGKLRSYLRRCLGNAEDAREIAQETYLRYLLIRDTKSVRQPHLYFYRIALNLASEYLHRRGRAAVVFDSSLTRKQSESLGDPHSDVLEQVSQRDFLQKVLTQMPWNYRQVLWMNKVLDMDHRDIAKELGLTPSTVLEYLARAAAHVRRMQLELR